MSCCTLRTVLHIDDDPDMRFLLRELAAAEPRTAAIQWLEASQVEEALAAHEGAQPDLVLLDNRLGAEEGVDLLPAVCAAFPCPVWVLSGTLYEALAARAHLAGAAGLVAKEELVRDPARLLTLLGKACAASAPDP